MGSAMLPQDVKYAIRALIKRRPGFTIVAVATLALGFGANTAIFSVVHAVLLRPLPFADPDRLALVRGGTRGAPEPGNLSPMDFLDLRASMRRWESLAAFNNYADATLTGAGEPERVAGTRVTNGFFDVLRVVPALGRDFRRGDDVPGAPPVAIVAHGFWRRRFGSDPSIVGRMVELNSVPTEIIGVLPPGFRHPLPEDGRQPDVWVPFRIDPVDNNRGGHFLEAIGRLRRDATPADGLADLSTIAGDLERLYPRTNSGRIVRVAPLFESMVGSTLAPLEILSGVVALVLLIACANLANLALARSAARRKEMAVRTALGATRADLVRQCLAESLLVAVAGTAVGLAIAVGAIRASAIVGSTRLPRAESISVDPAVLLFTLAVCGATTIGFGLGPAVASARSGTPDALKDGGRDASDAVPNRRARQVLVGGELALTLMLLVAAGLLIKSLHRLSGVDPGFQANHVLTLRTSLPLARFAEGDEIPFYQQLEGRVHALPGVVRVGAVNILPLSPNYSCDGFDIVGRPMPPPGQEPCAEARSITPGYFSALGVPLLSGRPFDAHDTDESPPVMIINENMADHFWPRQSPVGSRVLYQRKPREIVGVVKGVRHFGLNRDVPFEMYTPHAQQPSYHSMTLAIRAQVDPATLIPLVRRELSAIDRDVPIYGVATMDELIAQSTSAPRSRTWLVGTFAALAVLLSLVGVTSVVAYIVGRRTREIGVRVALGATPRQIVAMLVRHGMWPVGLGVLAGLVGASAVTRVLAGVLIGVTTTDAGVFASATLLLGLAALAATYVPARRALRLDPLAALRSE
jgi:putative ABC transport system permease protein